MALVPRTVPAGLGTAVGVVPEPEQRRRVAIGPQDDRAAVTAVTAVGTAPGHVRLTAERDRARAAVAPGG